MTYNQKEEGKTVSRIETNAVIDKLQMGILKKKIKQVMKLKEITGK